MSLIKGLLARTSFWVALLALGLPAGAALADRVVNSNEPVIISDDITDRVRDVVSASGASGDGESGSDGDGDSSSGDGDSGSDDSDSSSDDKDDKDDSSSD